MSSRQKLKEAGFHKDNDASPRYIENREFWRLQHGKAKFFIGLPPGLSTRSHAAKKFMLIRGLEDDLYFDTVEEAIAQVMVDILTL